LSARLNGRRRQSQRNAAPSARRRPFVIVEDGRLLRERMDKLRVDEEDVMSAARELQGLECVEQIKYAVMERNGSITIVPKR
jgi:uncharacterized membrane protein YcaP (DUF421 family)